MMNQYVALLRGINVGGKNIIKMTDLKACFEKMGLKDVATYIQSGNVIFKSPETDKMKLIETIEQALSKTFNYDSVVVVVSYRELKQAVDEAPKGFGSDREAYRYDVIFLIPPLQPHAVMDKVHQKEGVDKAAAGKAVLYFSRLKRKASQSHLSKVIKLKEYQSMTIRNWNTTTKLLVMMEP